MQLLIAVLLTYSVIVSTSEQVQRSERERLSDLVQLHRRPERTAFQDTDDLRECGLLGRDGRDGRDGIQGPFGPPGPTGPPGVPGTAVVDGSILKTLDLWEKQQERLLQKLDLMLEKMSECYGKKNQDQHTDSPPESTNSQEKDNNISPGGAVYTRWGRNVCPTNAKALYSGIMGGSHYKNKGDGTNHLCLPLEPQWNRTVAGHQSGAYIYGTEFQVSSPNAGFLRTNSGGKSQHDHEVQCVVCHTPSRPSHLMIPARLECPGGWTVEYLGFIMAAHNTHKPNKYVCVDQDPDVHAGTSANLNGHLLYIVEARCGSLPCPNYVEGYELTCVVCTK